MSEITLEQLWALKKFTPNPKQEKAIRHTDGPLFLTAGPGSGKTRVLLWRTLNLIVFQKVDPKKIFLATFTEKAAHQLKEGLQGLLGMKLVNLMIFLEWLWVLFIPYVKTFWWIEREDFPKVVDEHNHQYC